MAIPRRQYRDILLGMALGTLVSIAAVVVTAAGSSHASHQGIGSRIDSASDANGAGFAVKEAVFYIVPSTAGQPLRLDCPAQAGIVAVRVTSVLTHGLPRMPTLIGDASLPLAHVKESLVSMSVIIGPANYSSACKRLVPPLDDDGLQDARTWSAGNVAGRRIPAFPAVVNEPGRWV